MMIKYNWLVFGALITFLTCDAYKILVVFTTPSKSHGILGEAFVRYLIEAGHEVTYMTPFPTKTPAKNLHQVDLSASENILNSNTLDIKTIMDNTLNFEDAKVVLEIMTSFTETTLKNENVQKFLKDPNQHFDLVIAEWLYVETNAVFASVYDCPFIWFYTLEPHWMILSLIDEPLNPAYNTDYLNAYPLPFTFSQRVSELYSQFTWWYYIHFNFFYRQEKAYETYIAPILKAKGKAVPSFKDLKYNASLVLGNSHVSLGQATRVPQNYKAIGGYHVDSTIKPLPDNLQKIMDNSKNGVIFFSLGTNLKSKDLPDEIKRSLIKVFGELTQTVLWKFEEKFSNLPDNVHILDWAPQQSILSHPNCILFITHGGLLSTTEAIHYGVPFIGIPVFSDQFKNVDVAVIRGFGTRVDLSYTMADAIKTAIIKMTSDSSYRTKVKEFSLIYHDRPVTPGAELVHWVEHVVRTRGAPHLRSPALHVPWYQKLYLDLFAVILMIALLSSALLRRLYYSVVTERNKKKFD